HLSGTDVVGSMVVFINGEKNTNEYRRFKIKIDQNDDALAMNEVLTRRFNHPEWPSPNLILVDGPVRSHPKAIIIGLEKKLETIVLANGAKINLPKSNMGLQLLMAIRDESHRFAQSYHHVLRKKKMIE
ncbi:MAG: excinuclease ABC subunit C, partial [bacterium]|nr:excinuclease ABC subunit C [bacterium]